MENRSFDHLLGWVPRADGQQAGLWFTDSMEAPSNLHVRARFSGMRSRTPITHTRAGGFSSTTGHATGSCDRATRRICHRVLPAPDLDFFGRAVGDWTTGDRYFCPILGPTFPNRFFQHSAQTDRISNTLVLSQLPTIWDRIAQAELTARYYYSDLPFVALWGAKYLPIARTIDTFFADAAAGTLPNLAFIDPRFGGEGTGHRTTIIHSRTFASANISCIRSTPRSRRAPPGNAPYS